MAGHGAPGVVGRGWLGIPDIARVAGELISIAADAVWNAVEGLDIEAELDSVVAPLLPDGGNSQLSV